MVADAFLRYADIPLLFIRYQGIEIQNSIINKAPVSLMEKI